MDIDRPLYTSTVEALVLLDSDWRMLRQRSKLAAAFPYPFRLSYYSQRSCSSPKGKLIVLHSIWSMGTIVDVGRGDLQLDSSWE